MEMLVSYGLNHDAIAAIIGIHDDTLRKHYAQELSYGKAKVTAQVANSLVKKALSDRNDAISAAKFYLQSQAGWTERAHQELSGSVEFSGIEREIVRPKTSSSDG